MPIEHAAHRLTKLIAAATSLVLLLCADVANAQPGASPQDAPLTQRKLMIISVGYSEVVEPGWKISEAAVVDPEVADVRVVNPTRVLILGKGIGSTDVTMWGPDGQRWERRILVQADLEHLRLGLTRALPDAEIQITQAKDVIVVTGTLRRAEDADALERYLQATELKFANMTRVAGGQQVQLRVRVAEASRTAIRSLGVNAFHGGNDFFGGSTIGGNPNSINIGAPEGATLGQPIPFGFLNGTSVSDTVTLFAGFPKGDFQLFLEALEDNQYIRLLAEPTLVALSGEKASFLAGGEFPIPVPQANAGGGTTITIEYKEFGVRLNFRPVVLGDGTIQLQVAPEVSDLSDVGAIAIQGFQIPSLLTRRAATTLRMRSGQTFAMAGLINRDIAARAQSVPGIGKIPILGSLFRSVRYEKGETELVVLVTAELVEPLDVQTELPLPGDAHVEPNDWQLYAKGQIQGTPRGPQADAAAQWARKTGLDRLRGPGAWARYDQQPAPLRPEQQISPPPSNTPRDPAPTTR